MALVTIFLSMFFILGLFVGNLALAGAISALSPERGRRLGRKVFVIGLKSVYRPALTFNAADELTLKKRQYDEKHDAEKISFGNVLSSVDRYLFDPQNRIHSFYGTPFAFVDELFGIVVDPRDVIVGRLLRQEQESGEYTRRTEVDGGVEESVLGVFELPEGSVGVRLPDVRRLVGGSFDSQLVRKIREYYRTGQGPRASTTALRQMLIPIGAFIVIVLLGMFVAGQSGGGGGAGGGRSVGVGFLWLLLAMPDWRTVNWRDIFVGSAFVGITIIFSAGMYLAFPIPVPLLGIPLPLGVWGVVLLGMGMALPPIVASWFGRSLGPFGMLFGKLYIVIGLLGFDRPVITYTGSYEIREYGNHEWPIEPKWYRFALTRVGVALGNDIDVWPNTGVALKPDQVKEYGRSGDDGPAPAHHTTTDAISLGRIKGHVPKPDRVKDDSVYIRTDRSTGWFDEAGKNRRLMQAALQSAKEEFGGGEKPLGDKWILLGTLAAMAMAMGFNWLVFF